LGGKTQKQINEYYGMWISSGHETESWKRLILTPWKNILISFFIQNAAAAKQRPPPPPAERQASVQVGLQEIRMYLVLVQQALPQYALAS